MCEKRLWTFTQSSCYTHLSTLYLPSPTSAALPQWIKKPLPEFCSYCCALSTQKCGKVYRKIRAYFWIKDKNSSTGKSAIVNQHVHTKDHAKVHMHAKDLLSLKLGKDPRVSPVLKEEALDNTVGFHKFISSQYNFPKPSIRRQGCPKRSSRLIHICFFPTNSCMH